MKFSYNGRTFRVVWKHDRKKKCTTTTCFIIDDIPAVSLQAQPVEATGIAQCNKCDQFIKKTGRNISFRRAIIELTQYSDSPRCDRLYIEKQLTESGQIKIILPVDEKKTEKPQEFAV